MQIKIITALVFTSLVLNSQFPDYEKTRELSEVTIVKVSQPHRNPSGWEVASLEFRFGQRMSDLGIGINRETGSLTWAKIWEINLNNTTQTLLAGKFGNEIYGKVNLKYKLLQINNPPLIELVDLQIRKDTE